MGRLMDLTDVQAEVLDLVCRTFDETGVPPSQAAIARMRGRERASTQAVVQLLESKGWVTMKGRGVIHPRYYPDGTPFPSRSSLLAERDHLTDRVRELERQREMLLQGLAESA